MSRHHTTKASAPARRQLLVARRHPHVARRPPFIARRRLITGRHRRFTAPIAFLALLAAAPVRGQEPVDLSVDRTVDMALERDASVRTVSAEAAEARARLREVRSERLPALTARGDYTRLSEIPPVEFSLPGMDTSFTAFPVERDRYQFELRVEQPLFTGFRLGNEVSAAELQAEAAGLLEEQERATAAFEARRAYWTLYHAQALRDAVDRALVHVDEHLDVIRQQVEQGAALRADLLRARTRRAEVLVDRVEAENAIRIARIELNQVVGRPATAEVRLLDAPPTEGPTRSLDAFIAEAVDASPRLHALRRQADALEARVRATGGDRLPSLGFFGRYLYARPNPYYMSDPGEFHGTWELGLSTQWSIWEGGGRSARTQVAEAQYDAATARLQDASEELVLEVTRQYLETQRAVEALEAATLLVAEAEETLRVVRLQYQEGAALSEQVLDAERAWLAARARHARAEAELAIAHAGLLATLGRVR